MVAQLHAGKTVPDLLAGLLHLKGVKPSANGLIAEARYAGEMEYSNMETVSPLLRIVGCWKNPKGYDYKILTYFPKVQDVPAFARSAQHMIAQNKGPMARVFPGALGVLHGHTETRRDGKSIWTVHQIHGSFLRSKESGVTKEKWRPHRLWKAELLDRFFQEAVDDDAAEVHLRLKHYVGKKELQSTGPGNIEAFKEAAEAHGFEPAPHKESDVYLRAIRRLV